MTQIARTAGGGSLAAIPAAAPTLKLHSPTLRHALRVVLDPVARGGGAANGDDPGVLVRVPALTDEDRCEAAASAEMLERTLAPLIGARVMTEWLLPVNLGSRNPQSARDLAVRAAAIAEMCGDLPEVCFTQEARRRIASDGFFPSYADVRRAVEPDAMMLARQLSALRRLAEREPGPVRVTPAEHIISPADRARIAEHAMRAVAHMKASVRDVLEMHKAPAPGHVSPAQMVALLRRAGGHARADALAAKLEQRSVAGDPGQPLTRT